MRFYFEHLVPVCRANLFEFFQNPEGLEVLHAGWSNLRLLAHEPRVRVGAETWVEITLAGFIPMVLGFRHTAFEAPVSFAEEAIHGPFSRLLHIHEFKVRPGGTIVCDSLDIRVPWAFGGEVMVTGVVAPQITQLFRDRARALDRLARDGTLSDRIRNGRSASCR